MGEQVRMKRKLDHQIPNGSIGGLFTYYAFGDSALHRLDPRTKALWVVVGLVYIFSTDSWQLLLVLGAVNLLLTLAAGQKLRALFPVFQALILFGVVILIFQLLFQGGETFFSLGPVGLHTQGLEVTRRVWLRLVNLSLFFVQFMMWTHPTDLALMWQKFGIPYRYAMMGGLALRFFPIFQREVTSIQDAQKVRGQPLHTIWQQIAGMLTVFIPFVLRVLRRTNEIAISMELRGFGYGESRTYTRSIGMRAVDWWIAVLLLGVLVFRAVALSRGTWPT